MEQKRGLFIVFEGIRESGKGTQMINLAGHVRSLDEGQDIILTHGSWKNMTDKDIVAHSEDIDSRLNDGYFVFCELYKMSNCANQWTRGNDLFKLFRMYDGQRIIKPDLNIFMDISAETSEKRRTNRGENKQDFREFKFAKELVSHYSNLANRIDSKDLFGLVESVNGREEVNEVFEKVKSVFEGVYQKWKS